MITTEIEAPVKLQAMITTEIEAPVKMATIFGKFNNNNNNNKVRIQKPLNTHDIALLGKS